MNTFGYKFSKKQFPYERREAIKRLSEERRQSAAQIPWKHWAGFRDVLIHQYDGIDPVEVWLTVEKDLPTLKQAIVALLSTLPHVE